MRGLTGCTVLLLAVILALARDCEKLKVPFCGRMPYTETRLPNIYGDETQGEVTTKLEKLQLLQDSGCFGHYSFVLCAALAPPCLSDLPGPPAPCQHVCERARDRCYGLLLMYNATESWLDCKRLPKQEDDPLCMTPTSLTPRDSCHCLKKHQPDTPTKALLDKKDYDFSIKARMEGFAPSHFPSVISVTVLDIFRDGIVELKINNGTFIRTNTSCKCPELVSGQEYLIMGHEDFNRSELLLGKDSYVIPWTDPIETSYGQEARSEYRDPSRRHYSRHYHGYTSHYGYPLGFHRPSFSTILMAGGAYALYRHYNNKKKLGKDYGHPGYGGYGSSSSFGALGGGGYGALGNPRGKYTSYGAMGAAPAFGSNYGYNQQPGYGGGGYGRPANQVPSYPITHKPNYATSKPNFINRNPAYPATQKPSYPVTKKPYRKPYRAPTRRTSTSSRSRNRSWGSRSRGGRFGGRGGGGRKG